MSDTNSDIPKSLREALENGDVVPFVGAGVPMSVKKSPLEPSLDDKENGRKDKFGNIIHKSAFPSWWEFLIRAADTLVSEKKSAKADVVKSLLNDSPPDYLEAAQRAFDGLGQKQWYELLSENFEIDIESADQDSLKLADLIWKLKSNLILTTNVDSVLQSIHQKSHSVKTLDTQAPEFAEVQKDWKPSRPTVLHLHGHIDNKANVVFTQKQYDDFYNKEKNQAKLETLRNLFTQRTILFIGFSLDDLFILKELERVNLIYEGGASSYYVLIRESEKDNPNIPKYVEKITFAEFGKPLEDLVEELSRIAKADDDNKSGNSGGDNTNPPKASKSSDKKSFFNIPFGSKGEEFVGRKGKIEDIWKRLNQTGTASIGQAVSVKGFGGLGKTQLAVEYAHAKRGEYKNGVFWMVADQPIDVQLLTIGDEFGWTSKVSETMNQLDAAKECFRALSDCLILFDNVETYDEIKDYLPKADARTHILITSRERIPQFHQIDLELLEREESRNLLLKVSKRIPNNKTELEYLEKILETLGDIPLAVELVGGYLAEHELITFEKYHQFLEEVPLDKLEKEFPEGSFTNHDRSIIQTLRISEKTINEKPLMIEILKVLAWSGNSSMGISLLKEIVEAETDFEFENALNDAHKLRLLKRDEDEERFAIHRLLAKVIRYENPLDEQSDWYKKKTDNLVNWFRSRMHEFEYLIEYESEIEHLKVWQEEITNTLPEQTVYLLSLRANIPLQRGIYQTAFEYLEKSLKLYYQENLSNLFFLAFLQNEIGRCLSNLGKFELALNYELEALEIYRKLFSENHPHTATSLNNIGLTYGELGNHEEALKYQLLSLEVRRKLFSENYPETATSLNSIGGTYGDLGNYEEALKYQLQSLEIRQELFGENHPDTANSLNNIGYTYGCLENYEEALKYHLGSLEIHQRLLGKQHPNTIVIAGNVIITYSKLGKIEEAGRKAAEFFEFVPQNNPYWKWFEELSRPYRDNEGK